MNSLLMFRIASGLLWLGAVGFGLSCIYAIWSLRADRGYPIIMGFPAFAGGPVERYGIRTTVPLLIAFFLVCILEGVAGWLLWNGQKTGAILSMVLVPVGAVFWWGFALPFPPPAAIIRTILIVLGWKSLR